MLLKNICVVFLNITTCFCGCRIKKPGLTIRPAPVTLNHLLNYFLNNEELVNASRSPADQQRIGAVGSSIKSGSSINGAPKQVETPGRV
jgi:hypothetical protein